MTHTEIKKAWNTFKKEIAKEIDFDLTGCCYMNQKQIENGTATITLCNDIEYDTEVSRLHADIEKINGYSSWTAEEKQRSEKHNLDLIAKQEAKKAAHGTKANEAQAKATEITCSAAFIKMAKAIGVHAFELELVKKWEGLNVYQLRIQY